MPKEKKGKEMPEEKMSRGMKKGQPRAKMGMPQKVRKVRSY